MHFLDYLNTLQVVHRENDMHEFKEALMDQLETLVDIGGPDETPVDLFSEIDCEQEWRALQEMAEAGCNLQIANNSTELLSPDPPPALQPPAELTPPRIEETNTHSVCIKPNGRAHIHRPHSNQARRHKTILNVAARSRMPKRTFHTKPHHPRLLDGFVKQVISRFSPKNSAYEKRGVNVLTARSYRAVEHEREPFKLTFVRINA